MNHELPKGWLEVAIGNIAKVVGGGTPKSSDQSNFSEPGSGIPWLTPADLSGYTAKEISNGRRDLTAVGYENSSATVMPKGSLLFSSRAPIGYVAIASNEISTNQGFKSFVFSEGVNPSYAYYYLKSIRDLANERGSGSTFRELSGSAAKNLPFLLAPLPEQIRIADKLDRILARVNTAQTRLDKIPALIKRFRQTVLAEATSGELTREWRADDSRKDEFLTWNFSNIPEGWQLYFLPGISQSRLGKMLDKNKNQGIPVRYLGNINVRWGKFDLENLKEILVSEKEKNELTIKDGDLLVCEGGEPGRSAVWRGGDSNLTFQKALHRVRFDSRVVPEYGFYCFQNDVISNKMPTLYTGTTIKHLTGKALNRYPMAIPPIDEQHEIIRRVEFLFSLADTVEKQYRAAKARTDRLTQAVLAKAFRGELVPQDPADEPADVLLERIQAQRAEQAAAPKKRKSKTKVGSKKTAQSGPETETPRKTKPGKQSSKVINVTQSVNSSDDLLSLLKALGEESVGVDASILWKKSGLSIDDFYALLKQTEQIEDHVPSSDPAQRKLRVRK